MEQLWYTQQTDYLSQLSANDRNDLVALGKRHSYEKHDLIFQAGSPGDYVYLLSNGRAKIYQLSPTGKEVILWFCFSGEMFGMAEVCRRGQREVYARACSRTDVIKVSQKAFKEFLATHSEAAMLTIDLLSCRMRALGDMLLNLASDDVMSRLIKLLTRLSNRYGKYEGNNIILDIPLTHQEIADMIGASRQTVSSSISALKRRGYLDIENHCIHIKDSQSLFNFKNIDHLTATHVTVM
ncbi:MAG: Crp/Fnr family transcriptional regulator [Thioalkalispiraceae bacterium]